MKAKLKKGDEMKLKIYTDLHLFSPMQSKDKIVNANKSYFLGDVVDLVNCKKKDYSNAMLAYESLKRNALGFIPGNHEAMSKFNDFIKVDNRILLVHGDFEAWSDKRARKYRSKKHCAGWFKRNLWVKSLMLFEKIGKHKPSKKMINNLVNHAHFRDCATIIAGHKHPKETYDKVHESVRVIVLKRGYSEIEV